MAEQLPFRTQQECAQLYADIVSVANPQIVITSPSGEGVPSDWYVKSMSVGGVASALSQDIYINQRSQFPQTANGSMLDVQASAFGLPRRKSRTYAVGQGVINDAITAPVTIPSGVQFTDEATGTVYINQNTAIVDLSNPTAPIFFRAKEIGPGYQVAPNTLLTLSQTIPGVTAIKVSYVTDGSDAEDDAALAARTLKRMQTPAGGGGLGDFSRWAAYYPYTTDTFVFKFSVGQTRVIYTSILIGQFNPDIVLLNPSLPYTRSATAQQIEETYRYVETVRPENVIQVINTVSTYQIPLGLTATIKLVAGYALDTFIESESLTVSDLVKREIRRAIISEKIGASEVINPNTGVVERYILTTDIEQTLDIGLSATRTEIGIYASILLGRRVIFSGSSSGNIPVPFSNNILDALKNSQVVYDISYSNISLVIA